MGIQFSFTCHSQIYTLNALGICIVLNYAVLYIPKNQQMGNTANETIDYTMMTQYVMTYIISHSSKTLVVVSVAHGTIRSALHTSAI